MDQSQQEIKPPPVSAETAGQVIMNTRTTESGPIMDALKRLPVAIDTVAGVENIPASLRKTVLEALFGATTKDATLNQLRQSIETRMSDIARASDGSLPYPAELHIVLERAILESDFAEYYRNLNPSERVTFRERILATGLMQGAIRRIFVEKITTLSTTETSQYEAIQQELDELQQKKTTISTQINGIDASLGQKDVSQETAKKTALERSLQLLESMLTETRESIKRIEGRMATIRDILLRRGVTDLRDALAQIPEYGELESELQSKKNEESKLRTQIEQKNQELQNQELVLQQLARRTELQRQLDELDKQIAQKKIDAATAREALLRKVAELGVELDKILPAAANEALKQIMQRINEANKVRLENEARQRAEAAQKEGDMIKGIQAKIEAAIVRRYQQKYDRRRFLRSPALGFRINEQLLRGDFATMMTQGADAFVDSLLKDGGFQDSAGLTDEEKKFLQNDNNRRKVVEAAKQTIFTSVAQDAILHLKLDEQTIRTLAKMPEFINAVDAAITKDAKIREQVEKLAGQKLDNKGAVKRALEKLPVGLLVGILVLILFLLGKGLFSN